MRDCWSRPSRAIPGDADRDEGRAACGRRSGESPGDSDATRSQRHGRDTRRRRSEPSHPFPVNRPDGDLLAPLFRRNDIDRWLRRTLARCAEGGRDGGRQSRRRKGETDESDECGARHLLVIGITARVVIPPEGVFRLGTPRSAHPSPSQRLGRFGAVHQRDRRDTATPWPTVTPQVMNPSCGTLCARFAPPWYRKGTAGVSSPLMGTAVPGRAAWPSGSRML